MIMNNGKATDCIIPLLFWRRLAYWISKVEGKNQWVNMVGSSSENYIFQAIRMLLYSKGGSKVTSENVDIPNVNFNVPT